MRYSLIRRLKNTRDWSSFLTCVSRYARLTHLVHAAVGLVPGPLATSTYFLTASSSHCFSRRSYRSAGPELVGLGDQAFCCASKNLLIEVPALKL